MLFNTLSPGMIGIHGLALRQSIDLAQRTGFQGVTFDIQEAKRIADVEGVDRVKAMFSDAGLRPATWGPGVDWPNDELRDRQIEEMKPFWALARELGATNVTTGIMPANNERPYDEQYEYLITRLRPFAAALDEFGIRIGIEFITPKTLRDRFTYQFIYKMTDMLAFARDVGTGNVGLLFDLWHHYCAHGTVEDMDVLTADDVQMVHTNDAPKGLEIDEQQDLSRELPMATGVIPAVAMIRKLKEIGCDCAVAVEPFNEPLNELAKREPEAAARQASDANRALLNAAGVEA